MSVLTEPEYLNAEKNRWRVNKWSGIRELVSRSRKIKDAIVLYLPGPKDLDRDVAVSMGFRSYNLIGVDVDQNIINTNRRRSKYGIFIQSKLEDMIATIPNDFDIAAIDADLCCGLQGAAHALMRCMMSDALIPRDVVLSINLQRGRDPASNHVRKAITSAKNRGDLVTPAGLDLAKHRGVNFMLESFMAMEKHYLPSIGTVLDIDTLMPRPWLLSTYKSNRVFMDSLIFRWSTTHIIPMRLANKPAAKRNKNLWAAARATRTRYINEIRRRHRRDAA